MSITTASFDVMLPDPKGLWSPKEAKAPNAVDKLLNYLINYYCDPISARNAIRLFNGIDGREFVSIDEVRVSTLADIESALRKSGCKGLTWELAVTIKDFLQNMHDTLGACSLDDEDLEIADLEKYLRQLQGVPNSWEKDEPTPLRGATSTFLRKNSRKVGERILPDAAMQYLLYTLNQTQQLPFDYHSEKVLTRLGIMQNYSTHAEKITIYNHWIAGPKPMAKHRKVIEFSKLICLERNPRCQICPFGQVCRFNAANLYPTNT